MELIQTADQFKAAIQSYLKAHGMAPRQLALKVGRPQGTVEHWVYHGVKSEGNRRRIQEQYPWLFDLTGEMAMEAPPPSPQKQEEAVSSEQGLVFVIKTERAHEMVVSLTATLKWFLFKATADERNCFRDALGEDWEYFLRLTRAMTNEKAFEIAQQAGELKWNK